MVKLVQLVQKTHRRWCDCTHQNYHKACMQTFDAIVYLNKCSCAPILNFSPKCPIGSSAKGGNLSRVFLAIFAPVLAHPVASIAKIRLKLVSEWPMHCGLGGVFCRYCIAFHQRCICFLVVTASTSVICR